jgi:hypothetical protein
VVDVSVDAGVKEGNCGCSSAFGVETALVAPLGMNTLALAASEAIDVLADVELLLLVMLRLLVALEGVGVDDDVDGVKAGALGVKADELAVRLDDGVEGLDDIGVDVPLFPCVDRYHQLLLLLNGAVYKLDTRTSTS